MEREPRYRKSPPAGTVRQTDRKEAGRDSLHGDGIHQPGEEAEAARIEEMEAGSGPRDEGLIGGAPVDPVRG